MKNILKKLGVMGIIVAILIPFTELSVVNAASDCKTYLQNYLFIDTATGEEITDKDVYNTDNGDGIKGHANYSEFPKAFADGNVEIISVTPTMVTGDAQLGQYAYQFNQILNEVRNGSKFSNYDDYKKGGVVYNSKNGDIYERNTILGHQQWSTYGVDGDEIKESRWDVSLKSECDNGKAPCFIQTFIEDFKSVASVEVTPAIYKNNEFSDSTGDLKTFIQKIANDKSESTISFRIVRKLSSTDKKKTDYKSSEIEGEDAYKKQGYYWPFVLNVEYQVCGAESATKTWDLEYNENTCDDVTNMPSSKSNLELNKETDIDSRKPNCEGYTFKKWCINKDGSGDCYESGDKITSSTPQTITLFAQWGKAGNETQKPTGVVSYVIGFIAVGLVAGGIYLVAKKKNLFKQI